MVNSSIGGFGPIECIYYFLQFLVFAVMSLLLCVFVSNVCYGLKHPLLLLNDLFGLSRKGFVSFLVSLQVRDQRIKEAKATRCDMK